MLVRYIDLNEETRRNGVNFLPDPSNIRGEGGGCNGMGSRGGAGVACSITLGEDVGADGDADDGALVRSYIRDAIRRPYISHQLPIRKHTTHSKDGVEGFLCSYR